MHTLVQQLFDLTPRTVRSARDFATRALDSWGGCDRRDDIETCVSELAGNAVRHAAGPGTGYLVRLTRHERCVHLEVQDGRGGRAPWMRPLTGRDVGGRGLRIVQELSDDWGVDSYGADGKAVWTCFRRSGEPTPGCSYAS